MLRQHANCRLCTYAKEGKVVLRQHANCRLCTYVKEGKVVLRQHANCRLCTYAKEGKVVLRQHANCTVGLYLRPGSRAETARKLLRLKKPDNGKRTSEACKEAGQRKRRKKELLLKRTRNWNKDINRKESTVRTPILASNRGPSR